MPIYSSDSDDAQTPSIPRRLFGREKPLHSLFGGGRAADILLWREKNLSAAILIGSTVIWSLFEVGEYNFITLLCYIFMTTMLILFIWSSGAGIIEWNPPQPITIPESTFRWLFAEINRFLYKFYYISCGQDLKTFFVTIAILWIISGIGNYFSSLNLLYLGFVCVMTLPALYERYQDEVDYLAGRGSRDVKKIYRKIDRRFLNKIPRGPVKDKKKY
ncbi:reticulon-like protein B9 [Salvia hispanica]|uniref:reticulon-like protein B9 n=1 Tax=Salvia hispanica TaxID=49212 RepID=UPI0020094A52|nr:reticulon-like protein B9 [Salvia hispanica]